MTTISDNLQRVHERLQRACNSAGRDPAGVRLLAVSKTFGADAVQQAFDAGQRAFGENYIQEGVDKIALLRHLPVEWHMIGPIQSNKTRLVAAHFDWAQSIDRLKIAERLGSQRPAGKAPLQVCIQVNIDAGPNKSGVAPHEAAALAAQVAAVPNIQLRGIMVIPEIATDLVATCAVLTRANAVFFEVKRHLDSSAGPSGAKGVATRFDTLSMGMSADLEPAVQCGSTLVRVGTAIFGRRAKP